MADLNVFKNMKDRTDEFDPADIKSNRWMSVLSYLGPFVLIPVLKAKESKFAKFHANQGLIIFIIQVIVWILLAIPAIFLKHIPVIGFLYSVIQTVISVAFLLPSIVGIVIAAGGQAKEIPIVGLFNILK